MKKIFSSLGVLTVIVTLAVNMIPAQAAITDVLATLESNIAEVTGKRNVQQNAEFDVNIKLNNLASSQNIVAARMWLEFDETKLKGVSVTCTGMAINTPGEQIFSGGIVKVGCGKAGGTTAQNIDVATVRFKMLANVGESTDVKFYSGASIPAVNVVENGTPIDVLKKPAADYKITFSVPTPVATPVVTQTVGGGTRSSASSSSSVVPQSLVYQDMTVEVTTEVINKTLYRLRLKTIPPRGNAKFLLEVTEGVLEKSEITTGNDGKASVLYSAPLKDGAYKIVVTNTTDVNVKAEIYVTVGDVKAPVAAQTTPKTTPAATTQKTTKVVATPPKTAAETQAVLKKAQADKKAAQTVVQKQKAAQKVASAAQLKALPETGLPVGIAVTLLGLGAAIVARRRTEF